MYVKYLKSTGLHNKNLYSQIVIDNVSWYLYTSIKKFHNFLNFQIM